MGVFRGELYFFCFKLSIKFARVGVASNILPIIRLFKKGLP